MAEVRFLDVGSSAGGRVAQQWEAAWYFYKTLGVEMGILLTRHKATLQPSLLSNLNFTVMVLRAHILWLSSLSETGGLDWAVSEFKSTSLYMLKLSDCICVMYGHTIVEEALESNCYTVRHPLPGLLWLSAAQGGLLWQAWLSEGQWKAEGNEHVWAAGTKDAVCLVSQPCGVVVLCSQLRLWCTTHGCGRGFPLGLSVLQDFLPSGHSCSAHEDLCQDN